MPVLLLNQTMKRVLIGLAVVSGSLLAAASQGVPGSSSGGIITLRAAVLDISAAGIVASGSPVLTSTQGTIAAKQFTVQLGKDGRASLATASGGVRFSLVGAGGPSRTLTGNCSQALVYPSRKQAVLQGNLAAVLQGTGEAPLRVSGSRADIFGAMEGRPAHIEIDAAVGEIPTRA